MTLKFAIIADIHIGHDHGTKKGSESLSSVKEFINWTQTQDIEFVAEMGDRISDIDRETDKKNLQELTTLFNRIQKPLYHLFGNHDQKHLTSDDHEKIIGQSLLHFVVDHKEYSLIFWNPIMQRIDDEFHYHPNQTDIDWLVMAIQNIQKPGIIFSHMPLDDGSMVGNYYYNPAKQYAPFKDTAKILDVILGSGKIICCFSGHTHWNKLTTIDNVHFVTIPSITETFTTYPNISNAYAKVEIGPNITIEVFGNDPRFYRLPIRTQNKHWLPPKIKKTEE